MMYMLKRNNLNKIMFRKRIDRATLAKGAGISIETLNSWMYRETMATEETALKVVNYLGVNIDDIFDEVL